MTGDLLLGRVAVDSPEAALGLQEEVGSQVPGAGRPPSPWPRHPGWCSPSPGSLSADLHATEKQSDAAWIYMSYCSRN